MNVTCKNCAAEAELAESNADKGNWEVVLERGEIVGHKLDWKCSACDNVNGIFDAIEKPAEPETESAEEV